MSEVLQGASAARGRLLCAALTPSIFVMLALGFASPADAASILGQSGANGTNGGSTEVGAGGDGAGNAGSGGAAMTDAAAAGAGADGTAGNGGGGGGGGKDFLYIPPSLLPANGAAGGNSEYGSGGAGGTITSAAGGGGEEAGGGGGFGASSSNSGGGGGGGGGGRGLSILTQDGSIALGDTVTGGAGGNGGNGGGGLYADGGAGGGGGIGVVFGGTGVFSVDGVIAGGAGGNGGDSDAEGYGGSGGAGGTGLRVVLGGVTVDVDGTVSGGNGGARGASDYSPTKSIHGLGGVGIIGADLTVVVGPDGSITGGLGGDALTRANAVTFTGGANIFELQSETSNVIGNVVADGTDDAFRLGGANAGRTFETTLLGTQYTGFERFEKVGAGKWTLTGTPGVATAWSVSDGTLALPGAMTTDITTAGSGIFALQGGTLDGVLDNRGVTRAYGGITGAINNEATGTFNLGGDLAAGGLITNDGLFTAFGSPSAGSFAVSGGGGFINNGTISLRQSGSIAGDVLDLTGAGLFEGDAGGEFLLDIDLSTSAAASADRLLLGATAGELALRFDSDPALYGARTDGLLVVQTADGNLQATATGLQDRGLVHYAFEQIGTDWYVTGRLNAAQLGGVVVGMQSVQDITDAAFRPAALDPARSCAAGIHGSALGGRQGASGDTSASDGEHARSDATLTYGGARFDLDFGCLDLGQGDAAIRFGLVGGFNTGNARHRQVLADGLSMQSSNDFSTGYAAAYAQLRSGGLVANGQFGYDRTGFDLSGSIVGGSGAIIDAQQTSTRRFTAMGSIGYDFPIEEVTLTPSAGLSFSSARTGSIHMVDMGGRLDFADRDAVTAFGGLELAARTVLAGGRGSLRYFASGALYQDLGGAQSFTYRDDINGATALETSFSSTRGMVSAGLTYEAAGGAFLGLRGDLGYSGGEVGASLALRAGLSF